MSPSPPAPIEVGEYWKQALAAFLTAIRDEEDTEALRGYFDGFAKVCWATTRPCIFAPAALSNEDSNSLVDVMHLGTISASTPWEPTASHQSTCERSPRLHTCGLRTF